MQRRLDDLPLRVGGSANSDESPAGGIGGGFVMSVTTQRRNFGWFLVALGFVVLGISFSGRATLGMLMTTWESELGWSRYFTSSVGASTLIIMALVAPVSGVLVDRLGPRLLLSFGTGALGSGLLLAGLSTAPWQLAVAFGLIGGVGFGIVAMHVVATAIAPSFDRQRGLATGIATSGATAGQLLIVPALAVVIAAFGWRYGLMAAGLVSLAMVPVILWLTHGSTSSKDAVEPSSSIGSDLRKLFSNWTFHALLWSFTICGFTTAGVIETHLLPYAAFCGFPPLPSASAYGVLSVVNFLGMIIAGHLSDKLPRVPLLAFIYLARAFTFILLIYVPFYDLQALFLFAVLFGLFDYSTVPVTANLVASHVGLRTMGLAMGIISAGHASGAAIGAFAGGYIFDLLAQYTLLWSLSFVSAIVAAALVLSIGKSRRPDDLPPPIAELSEARQTQ
ncbi:MAG: MFS transporter [Geminicoccaceae bacterium]